MTARRRARLQMTSSFDPRPRFCVGYWLKIVVTLLGLLLKSCQKLLILLENLAYKDQNRGFEPLNIIRNKRTSRKERTFRVM